MDRGCASPPARLPPFPVSILSVRLYSPSHQQLLQHACSHPSSCSICLQSPQSLLQLQEKLRKHK